MNAYFEEAKKKLKAEAGAGKFDKYGSVMKSAVVKALEEFCDHYCRFPREALDEEILHEAHCSKCPMVRLLNLGV